MSLKRRVIGGLMATAVLGALFTGPASAMTIVAPNTQTCEESIAAQVNVSQALIDHTCNVWAQHSGRDTETLEVPTIAMAWTNFGVDSSDGQLGVAGWPISATCLITGVITGPTTAYYVLTGVGNTTGPATSTTVQCSASPAGLSFEQTLPGPNSAGADFTTTIFPGSALRAQRICSYAEAYYLVRPLFMQTNKLDCSPKITI
jgi:hypothetical protein